VPSFPKPKFAYTCDPLAAEAQRLGHDTQRVTPAKALGRLVLRIHRTVRTLRWSLAGFCMICGLGLTADATAVKNGPKRAKTDTIVLHATGGPRCEGGKVIFTPAGSLQAIREALANDKELGIHFIVDRNGAVERSVPDDEQANHAKGFNRSSIGIEMINRGDGKDLFPSEQVNTVARIVKELAQKYGLKRYQVKTHEELDKEHAPCGEIKYKRKQDPGAAFPLSKMLDQAFPNP
jgi:N-acetylmuramoyl-L-alanine amidase